ncbi:MAG: hypothetical protein RQ966_11765 [Acetobacteraceae bacterium]|nr:hypothetical protein [Acetobacteraceae bacterium]
MSNATQNGAPCSFEAVTFRLPALANAGAIKDAGQVRLGGQGPVFRLPSIGDAGTVRLGGQGPVFRLASVADAGRVRLGGQGPLFR